MGLGEGYKPSVADCRDMGGGKANSLGKSECKEFHGSHSGITLYTIGIGEPVSFHPGKPSTEGCSRNIAMAV